MYEAVGTGWCLSSGYGPDQVFHIQILKSFYGNYVDVALWLAWLIDNLINNVVDVEYSNFGCRKIFI